MSYHPYGACLPSEELEITGIPYRLIRLPSYDQALRSYRKLEPKLHETLRKDLAKEIEGGHLDEISGTEGRGKKAKVKVETLVIHIKGQDVKEARKALHVSQPQFARLLQVSSESVKKWEQNVNPVPGAVSQWVQAALRHPKTVRTLLSEIAP